MSDAERESRYAEAIGCALANEEPSWAINDRAHEALTRAALKAVLPLMDAEVAAAVSEAQAEAVRQMSGDMDANWRLAKDAEAKRDEWHEMWKQANAWSWEERDKRAAAEAEVERLRELARIGVELDNHHNAAVCPYCTPALPAPSPAATTGEAGGRTRLDEHNESALRAAVMGDRSRSIPNPNREDQS